MEIINQPSSMVVGQTYSFQARMMVQNYDAQCNPTPWYYATNTPISWTFTNETGQSYTYQCTTANDGTCSVSFQCLSAGTWTVNAQWVGNEGYVPSSGSVTLQAT